MSPRALTTGASHVEGWPRPGKRAQRGGGLTSCSCMRSASKLLAFFSFSLAVAKISSLEARESSSSLWKSFI